MKAPAHFHQLKAACLPRIEDYHADLLKHDRRAIRRRPTTPFIHLTRQYGTYITMLPPAEEYPPQGVEVPYLFGKADRWHLLKEVSEMIRFGMNYHPDSLLHYFDGENLRTVTYPQAQEIVRLYTARITESFRNRQLHAA